MLFNPIHLSHYGLTMTRINSFLNHLRAHCQTNMMIELDD